MTFLNYTNFAEILELWKDRSGSCSTISFSSCSSSFFLMDSEDITCQNRSDPRHEKSWHEVGKVGKTRRRKRRRRRRRREERDENFRKKPRFLFSYFSRLCSLYSSSFLFLWLCSFVFFRSMPKLPREWQSARRSRKRERKKSPLLLPTTPASTRLLGMAATTIHIHMCMYIYA